MAEKKSCTDVWYFVLVCQLGFKGALLTPLQGPGTKSLETFAKNSVNIRS